MKYLALCILLLITTQIKSQPDMAKDKIIEKERVIDAEMARVWDVLTTPTYMEKWLGTKSESEWEKGSRFH